MASLRAFFSPPYDADRLDTKVKGAIKKDADVLSTSWLLECAAAARRLPAAPRHYLHLSRKTREAAGGAMDEFGDPFFQDLSHEDVAALLSNIMPEASTLDAPELARALAAPEEGWDWEAPPAADARARAAAEAEVREGRCLAAGGGLFLLTPECLWTLHTCVLIPIT